MRKLSAAAAPSAILIRAQQLLASGQLDQAESTLLPELANASTRAEANYLLAVAAVMGKRAGAGVERACAAIEEAPQVARYHFALGRALKQALDIPAAIDAYRRALELDPDHAEVHVSLGIALKHSGDLDAAIACYQRAIEIDPKLAVAHGNLGIALAAQAERAAKLTFDEPPTDDLLRSLEQALKLDSGNALLHRNHGAMLMHLGRYREAADVLNQALGMAPDDVECCLRLGECLRQLGHSSDLAVALHERWLSLNAPAPPVMRMLADLYTTAGRLDEAIVWAEKALALDPDASALLQLAVAYQQSRRVEEAVALGRKATEMAGERPDYHPMILLTSNYLYEEPEPIFELHTRFGEVLARSAQPALGTLSHRKLAPRMPGQRLKVGYVSGDFMSHSVSYFIGPLLERHDRSRFDVVCYHNRAWGDAVTKLLRAHGHEWVESTHLTDLQFSRRVRADGVHILIDLGGHTSNSRVNAFALRPAPVQISYLGYPTISGVDAIDFRITDGDIDPGDMPARASELPLCLPRSMFCYRPPQAPAIGAPPVRRNGFVTFGSFNNVAKLSDQTLRLWVRVLHLVPSSLLLLKATTMNTASVRDNIFAFMGQHGIAPDRLRLLARTSSRDDHLALYNEIDVALDSFPYNGATTTCEALWMGVPVVSRRGRTHASRMGASILGAAGLAEWVVDNDEAYVAKAALLAADADGLARWRAQARTHLASSALFDEVGFTRSFEAALDQAWARAGTDSTS